MFCIFYVPAEWKLEDEERRKATRTWEECTEKKKKRRKGGILRKRGRRERDREREKQDFGWRPTEIWKDHIQDTLRIKAVM
jgi:hypothetical protein